MKRGILLAPLLLTGCGGFEPDMADLEQSIGADLAEQVDANADRLSVDCPTSIEWRVGDEFRCFAEDRRGNRVAIVVHMENDNGEYAWEVDR